MARTTKGNTERLEIWQWNCHRFRKQQSTFRQYKQTTLVRPDIVALQETCYSHSLTGYDIFLSQTEGKATTLVSKTITAIQHPALDTDIEHVLTEIISHRRGKGSMFILNVYSPSRQRNPDFEPLIKAASKLAKKNGLVVLGDFNAQHKSWGYVKETSKRKNLTQVSAHAGLESITNFMKPTRMGNSVSRDTCPDLTFVKYTHDVYWENAEENLGSSHFILWMSVATAKVRRKLGQVKITNWNAFRQDCIVKSIQAIAE